MQIYRKSVQQANTRPTLNFTLRYTGTTGSKIQGIATLEPLTQVNQAVKEDLSIQ